MAEIDKICRSESFDKSGLGVQTRSSLDREINAVVRGLISRFDDGGIKLVKKKCETVVLLSLKT